MSYFKNSGTTTARLAESSDAQLAAAYFAQDVASTGHRGNTWPFPLVQSVWTTQAGVACGAGVGTPVVILAGDDFSGNVVTPSTVYVAYELSGTELHRVRCTSGGTTNQVLARNVISAAPQCAPTLCTMPSPVPATITLVLTLERIRRNRHPLHRHPDRRPEADMRSQHRGPRGWFSAARRAAGDDTGASLVIALIMITVVALVVGSVLLFSDTGIRATVGLRSQASEAYSADSAAQVAVDKLRTASPVDPTFGCTSGLLSNMQYPASPPPPAAAPP